MSGVNVYYPPGGNNTLSAYANSNTTQSSSGTLNATSLNFAGAGIASVGITNGSVLVSVPTGGGAGDGVNILAAGTQTANTTGTVMFSNSNNVSFGMSNSSIVTASASFNQSVQTQGMVSINGGTGDISFSNSNGITFGRNVSTITASHNGITSQTNQNVSLYALGNTTQNSSTLLNASNLSFNAIGSLTAGFSNGSIQLSAPNALTSQSNQAFSASGGSSAFQTLNFANSNGLTFTNTNGSVAASYTVPTVTNSSLTISDNATSLSAARIAFTNLNGVTLSLSTTTGGSMTVVGSHNALTTARASTDAIGLNTAQSNVTWTANSSGLSLDARGYAGTGTSATNASITLNSNGLAISVAPGGAGSSWTVSDNATSATVGRLAFTNSNGLTMSLSTSNNGNHTVIGSYTVPTVTNSSLTVQAGASTLSSVSRMAFVDSNGVSFGASTSNNGSVSITASHNGLTSQSNQAASASNGSFAFQTINFSNANNVTFGTSAGGIVTASVAAPGAAAENNNMSLLGNVVGNSTASGSTIAFSGGNNVTLSGTNGSVIRIDAGGGGAAATLSYFRYPNNAPFNASSTQSFGASTMAIQPFQLPFNVSASYLRMPVSVGFGSTTFASGANTTHSLRQTNTYYAIIYSQGVGASSRSIQSVYSSSLTDVMQVDARIGAASNNQTVSHFFTHGATGNSSIGFTTGYSPAASSIVRVSTTHLTNFTGARFLDIPFATLLSPGNYWLGIQVSSATAVSGTAAMNANTQKVSYYNQTQVSANINEYGGNTTAGSNMWQGFGHGNWTTNSSGATTASINLAQVSTVANQPVFPFELRRQA